MTTIGTVESLWRYPVKSMSGEAMTEAFMGFSGFFGDRCFAFKSSAARKGFPYLTATIQEQMLRYRPQFRYPERAAKPPNLAEASSIAPGINPANPEPNDMIVDVITPSGAVVAVDDPALIEMLGDGMPGEHHLTLLRSDRAMTDCRPVSLISVQSIRQLETEMGIPLDKRRFRANIYLDLASDNGFAEDALVGRKLRIGPSASAAIDRARRCEGFETTTSDNWSLVQTRRSTSTPACTFPARDPERVTHPTSAAPTDRRQALMESRSARIESFVFGLAPPSPLLSPPM